MVIEFENKRTRNRRFLKKLTASLVLIITLFLILFFIPSETQRFYQETPILKIPENWTYSPEIVSEELKVNYLPYGKERISNSSGLIQRNYFEKYKVNKRFLIFITESDSENVYFIDILEHFGQNGNKIEIRNDSIFFKREYVQMLKNGFSSTNILSFSIVICFVILWLIWFPRSRKGQIK